MTRTPVPVVLLHGARTSRTMWRAQVEALERSGRPALAVDLPGHGTRADERFDVRRALEVVDEAVDLLGGRAVVVGLSLGGYLGIAYAGAHPERVAGLLAAACSTDPGTRLTGAWRRLAALIGRLPDRGAWLNQAMVDLALPPEAARDLGEGGFALDVMVDMLTVMREVRPLEDLSRTRCPVWLVNGTLDHFRAQERAFLAACPDGRLVHVHGATHLVSLVRPVAFTRVLLEALDEVDAREAAAAVPGADGTQGGPRRQSAPVVRRSSHARTPPTIPAVFGTTTTSSPIAASAVGRTRRALPPPR